MGKKDDIMYDYLDDHDKFADLMNVVLYQGEQVIDASMLEADDTRYVKKSQQKNGKACMGNRHRDLKKRLRNGGWVAVAAIENQETVDATMPLRIMEYDCLEYQKQVKRIRKSKEQKLKEVNVPYHEWNTRLTSEDKINPIQTICLYHGTEEWTGPQSLKDMVNFKDAPPGWEERFHDYGMTLFCANRVQDYTKFKTELGQLLQVIPYKNDKEQLKSLFQREEYSHLERETAEAIAVMIDNESVLNKLDEYEVQGGYNMCVGLDDWAKEEQEKGKIEMLLQDVQKLMQNLRLTAEEAMEVLEVPQEERTSYLAKL